MVVNLAFEFAVLFGNASLITVLNEEISLIFDSNSVWLYNVLNLGLLCFLNQIHWVCYWCIVQWVVKLRSEPDEVSHLVKCDPNPTTSAIHTGLWVLRCFFEVSFKFGVLFSKFTRLRGIRELTAFMWFQIQTLNLNNSRGFLFKIWYVVTMIWLNFTLVHFQLLRSLFSDID